MKVLLGEALFSIFLMFTHLFLFNISLLQDTNGHFFVYNIILPTYVKNVNDYILMWPTELLYKLTNFQFMHNNL